MAEENPIEMQDLGEIVEEDEGRNYNDDEETNLDDDTNFDEDESLIRRKEQADFSKDIPDFSRLKREVRSELTERKKMFLRQNFGIKVNKGFSKRSKALYDNLSFDGKKVFYEKIYIYELGIDGKAHETTSKQGASMRLRFMKEVNFFRDFTIESGLSGDVEGKEEAVEEIENEIIDDIEKTKEFAKKHRLGLSRIMSSVLERSIYRQEGLSPEDRIEFLDVERKNFSKAASAFEKDEEIDMPNDVELYRKIEKIIEKEQECIRIKSNISPKDKTWKERVLNILDNTDFARLERFKEWAKKHIKAISGISIGLASIITTIIFATRALVKKASRGVKKMSENIKKTIGTVSPLVSGILSILGNVLNIGGELLQFVAKNLWIFIILFTTVMLGFWESKKRK